MSNVRIKRKNKIKKDSIIVLVFLIIILVLVSIAKLGWENISKNKNISIDDKRKEAKEIHDLFEKELNEHHKEKAKILKYKKNILKIVRMVFVLLWVILNFIVYHFKNVTDLQVLFFYNQLFLLFIVSIVFIFVGNISDLKSINNDLKNKIDNLIYSSKLEILNTKIEALEQGMNELKPMIDSKTIEIKSH